jgi:hypothetical protein
MPGRLELIKERRGYPRPTEGVAQPKVAALRNLRVLCG